VDVGSSHGFRDGFLRILVIWGVALFAITEMLSAFAVLRPVPLLLCWVAAIFIGGWFLRSRVGAFRFQLSPGIRDPIVLFCGAGIAGILILIAITALYSPPNSADAMAYHMPRVVYWAEQASVRFFPTPYLNQIMLQPLAEYAMLHTYLLSGGDRFVNLVQWFGCLGSVVAVSALAREFGAGVRGQALAALFCVTLPSGILAASGAKNDYFLAMWLVASLYFAWRFAHHPSWAEALFCGAAAGLALLTKATAYLFLPWLLAAVLWPAARHLRWRHVARLAAAGACALLLSTPHYVRNRQLSGSILGFDSAQGDGFFRWPNETFGWRQTASNILRNLSEQSGGRSERWNRLVYSAVVSAHRLLAIDVNDPSTTWRWSTFQPPRNANHEADANSHWHLLILAAACVLAAGFAFRRREWHAAVYAAALLCGFVSFCAYLKWQPYEARLFLPLMVASAPLVGAVLDTAFESLSASPRVLLQLALCLFLVSVARLPVLENWVRPLRGPRSVLRVPRNHQYFADMVEWDIRPSYEKTAALLASGDCRTIGFDSSVFPLEYPLMALLREQHPDTLFLHAGVENPSARFRQPVEARACAIVCPNCAGDPKRESLYGSFPRRTAIDKFLVWERP